MSEERYIVFIRELYLSREEAAKTGHKIDESKCYMGPAPSSAALPLPRPELYFVSQVYMIDDRNDAGEEPFPVLNLRKLVRELAPNYDEGVTFDGNYIPADPTDDEVFVERRLTPKEQGNLERLLKRRKPKSR